MLSYSGALALWDLAMVHTNDSTYWLPFMVAAVPRCVAGDCAVVLIVLGLVISWVTIGRNVTEVTVG